MPAKRLSMRKIKEVLRLKAMGFSNRKIARTCAISRPAVAEYIRRAKAAGLEWPLPTDLSDTCVESRLFPPSPYISFDKRPIPDWSAVRTDLKRKGVTMFLLWQEYKEANPGGFQYSWFCDHYRLWAGKLVLCVMTTWPVRSYL